MSKRGFKSIMSLLLVSAITFSGSGFHSMAFNPDEVQTEQGDLAGSNIVLSEWKSIAMGQSTDLNFQSTIHPEKVGVNQSDLVRNIQVQDENGETITKDAVVIESRGGKIANGHDGLTFFYTELPVDNNFVLEAKVYLNQFGPWNVETTPSKQEAIGLMVRDAISEPRQNPMLEGYEELPACSNMVSTMLMAKDKKTDTAINVVSYQRNGVYSLSGNGQIEYKASTMTTLTERGGTGDVTQDLTPTDNIYQESDFFTLKIEKTDSEIVTTYINSNNIEKKLSVNDSGRLAIIDQDKMYLGLYAARNAKVTFTDINLTATNGNLQASEFVPSPYDLKIDNYSNKASAAGAYNVVFRTNYNGTMDIYKDNVKIVSEWSVTAGEDCNYATEISNTNTDFSLVFKDQNNRDITESFTVTMISDSYKNKDLYASPIGVSDAAGTAASPLDINTALNYVSDGYTVYALGGTYGALDILTTMSGSAGKMKTLKASDENNAVIFRGESYLRGSHWNLDNIKITGSSSAGMRVHGSYNTIENCEFYENKDTGLQLGLGSNTSSELWPKANTVRYCYSHHNVDDSGINADGFAAKLGIGTGNIFEWCESAYNADDGWDIFNKVGDIPNKPITIKNCVAYGNGNNGFKLGGEGYPVDNVIEKCLAFSNGLDGFTCNFNTGELTVTNNTSFDNIRYNYIFRYNPHKNPENAGKFVNNLSFKTSTQNQSSDYIYSTDRGINYFFVNGTNSDISSSDFVSMEKPTKMVRNEDKTFNYQGFMQPVANSKLVNGSNSTYVGAVEPEKKVEPVTVAAKSVTMSNKTWSTNSIGATKTLNATISPANVTNKTITWTTSNKKVATVSKGKVKAVGNGSATITAAAEGKKATCKVTVSQRTKSLKLTLNKKNIGKTLAVQKGKTYNFQAVVTPSNADKINAKVTYSVSNKKIATVTTGGKVKIKKAGKVIVTAKTGDKRIAKVTLNASNKVVKVTKVKLSGKKLMKVKGKQQLQLTVAPLTANNQKVTWTTSNKKIAVVSTKGVVTAKKKGKVTIRATAKDGSKKRASVVITVK